MCSSAFLFNLILLILPPQHRFSEYMAAIKVHGNPLYTASARVLACLFEKGLEFDLVLVDVRSGQHKAESFLSLNPFGQIPAFEDGDLKLFESRAITRYIAHEYADKGTPLVVSGTGKEMAVQSMWMKVEAHEYDPVALELSDPAAVVVEEEKLGKVLDAFSLADLHHLPSLSYLMNTRVKELFESRPLVSAWVADILCRPAWCKVMEMRRAGNEVHGSPMSTATCRVLATLIEKGLDFEFVNVDMRSGEHKKPHFLALSPFGQVPAFEDGDLKLFESRAITQHIAHAYGDKGTPLVFPGKEMATVSVWMEVEAHQYDPAASKLLWELALKPFLGMQTDPAVVVEFEPKLEKVLDVYEARLSKSKYLGGDCFTLADLHHLPSLNYLLRTEVKKHFDARPKVSAWVADITSRPAWCKSNCYEVLDLHTVEFQGKSGTFRSGSVCGSPLEAVALALCFALDWASSSGWTKIVVETDLLVLFRHSRS
ncbi:hypothetical protein SAY86_001864 [Trapa natans]|uniref:glutathione transferase n=1 Tax=Trapa natans TaxID=22666 RepID=A0AAN7LGW8_TRANT|nr:hypothetical protein SAY86_001864 [Trapa natans]